MRNIPGRPKHKEQRAQYNVVLSTLYLVLWTTLIMLPGLCFIGGCSFQEKLHKDTRILMGTYVQVTSASPEAAGVVFGEFTRLEGILSIYDPESELSRLNREGKLKVSDELYYCIRKSREFREQTEGAFDITVAPLVELWGFKDQRYRVPEAEEITEARKTVGMDKIIMQDDDNMIEFIIPQLHINLGGIAKGYAIDKAVQRLKEKGIKSCLINAGGQVYGLGERSPGVAWQVASQHPRLSGELNRVFELKNNCVSTSGDYEQYFVSEGKRYSHIIDPRTGYPVDNGVVAVTVIAPDGVTADALSTAAFVLGQEGAEALEQKFKGVKVDVYVDQSTKYK